MDLAEKDIELLKERYNFLNKREIEAYREFSLNSTPRIDLRKVEEFYGLFSSGRTCLDIYYANKGYTLGQIVDARIRGKWDERIKDHIEKITQETNFLVGQVKLESIAYQADLLRVHHKLYGAKMAKFLQTGNETDLDGVPIPSYKTMVQLFMETVAVPKVQHPNVNLSPVSVEVNLGSKEKSVDGEVVKKDESADFLRDLAKKVKGE